MSWQAPLAVPRLVVVVWNGFTEKVLFKTNRHVSNDRVRNMFAC